MDQRLKRREKFIKVSEHCLSSALDCARIQCPCIGNDNFVVVLLFHFKSTPSSILYKNLQKQKRSNIV